MNFKRILMQTHEAHRALGHFNVSSMEAIRAVIEASRATQLPVVMGVSEGEAGFVGLEEIAAVVHAAREKESVPVFLNADHFKDVAKLEAAARAGFDSVLFDASAAGLEVNVEKTKDAALRAKRINSAVLVEGELGYIGSGSVMREEIPEGAAINKEMMPTPEQATWFIRETGVDLIGPAVGNIHGLVRGFYKQLDFERIKALSACGAFVVLHGASGIHDQDLAAAVAAGVSVVHINTELRKLWQESIEKSLHKDPGEITPYKILEPVSKELQKQMEHWMRLFAGEKQKT
jgi:fructose-bisphosphate aldolase class II